MEEKKEIKVRFSTTIYLVIIFALIVALGVIYYFGFVADKNEKVGDEKITITEKNLAQENETDKKIVTNEEKNNKLDEKKCKENFQKYLDISATFESHSLNILKELELVNEEFDLDTYNQGIEFNDVESWDMSHFTKTDIKNNEYKEKMQEYMTLECMKQNFYDYTRSDEGYLCVVDWGGTYVYQEVQKLEESSSYNVYNIKVLTRAEDDGSKGTTNYIVTFDDNCKVKSVKEK